MYACLGVGVPTTSAPSVHTASLETANIPYIRRSERERLEREQMRRGSEPIIGANIQATSSSYLPPTSLLTPGASPTPATTSTSSTTTTSTTSSRLVNSIGTSDYESKFNYHAKDQNDPHHRPHEFDRINIPLTGGGAGPGGAGGGQPAEPRDRMTTSERPRDPLITALKSSEGGSSTIKKSVAWAANDQLASVSSDRNESETIGSSAGSKPYSLPGEKMTSNATTNHRLGSYAVGGQSLAGNSAAASERYRSTTATINESNNLNEDSKYYFDIR